jgi:uncharacterized delta-60 repeat protein/RHS repeat-associated protein
MMRRKKTSKGGFSFAAWRNKRRRDEAREIARRTRNNLLIEWLRDSIIDPGLSFFTWLFTPRPPKIARTTGMGRRRLAFESLETRRMLDGSVAALLASETPNPHPTGDPPSVTAQVISLTSYTAPQLPFTSSGDPDLEELLQGLQQIYNNISSNPQARPSYWGETVASGGNQYELHLSDNGMLIRTWTINWNDGSQPQVVTNQPWVVHTFAGNTNQYAVTVTASSVDGTYAAGIGQTAGTLDQDFDAAGFSANWSSHGNPNWASDGNSGQQTTNFESGSGFDQAAAVASDDGNILVVGTTGSGQFGLVRYIDDPSSTNDGNTDTSFGASGLVTTTFSIGNATAAAVAVDSTNDTIVAAGTVLDGSGHNEVALARYNDADGSLDTTFGTGGLVTLDLGTGWTSTNAVAIDSSGGILVAGCLSGQFAVLRFNSNGTQDTSFGSDGVATVSFGGTNETPSAMAINSDGLIFVAGTTTQSSTGKDFALAQFNSDGTLNADGFGLGGTITTDFGENDVATSIAIQPNGQILVAGYTEQSGSTSFALARYNDGEIGGLTIDTSFGTHGKVTTSFGDGDDMATGVAVDCDGNIIVCGSTLLDGNDDVDSVPHFAVARYLTDGTLDSTFGAGTGAPTGTVTTDFTGLGFTTDSPAGLFVDANGRLIVGGTATQADFSSFAVACYDPGVSDLGLEVNDVPPVLQLSGDQVATAGQDLDLSPIGRFTHAPVTSGDFTYQIDWNDGTTPDTGTATIIDPGSDTSPLVGTISDDHTYAAAGVYYVAVTVTDPNGGSDTQSLQVTVNADPPTPSDPGLLAAARQALGLPANASVSAAQWASITSLTADSNQVLSLAGLENAVNLQSLTLVPSSFADPGHLTDLSPLSGLTNLKNLTLQDCDLNDTSIATLLSLPALQTLDLRYNAINTVPTAVASEPALTSLLLYGNPLGGNATQTWYASLSGRLLTVDIAPNDPQKVIQDIVPGSLTAATTTATFQALAAAFYNLPLEIYQYLVNTIQYQPYEGAMKGPLAVLQTSAGNDWDTDSLLAAVLGQVSTQAVLAGNSAISVQYVYGQVVENLTNTENRLAVKTAAAAYDALSLAGLIPTLEDGSDNPLNPTTQLSSAVNVAFNHAWLSVAIAPPGSSTPATYLLDPSWKLLNIQSGLTGFLNSSSPNYVPFATDDSSGFYLNPTSGEQTTYENESAAEYYENAVRSYLATNDPTITIADVPYQGTVQTQYITSLPTQLPPSLAIVGTPSTASSIPSSLTYQFGISVDVQAAGTVTSTTSGTDGSGNPDTTINVSSGVFTSSMVGAPVVFGTQAYTIETYTSSTSVVVLGTASVSSGSTFSIPGFSSLLSVPNVSLEPITIGYATSGSNLTPDLFLNGSFSVASSSSVSSGASVDVVLQSYPAQAVVGTTGGDCVPYTHVYVRTAGDDIAVGLGAWQTSASMLSSARAALNSAELEETDGGSPADNLLTGGALNLAIAEYFQQCNADEQTLAGVTGGLPLYNVVSSGIASAYSATTEQNTSVEYPYLPGSMGIDAADNNYLAFSNDESSVTSLSSGISFPTAEDEARYNLIGCDDSSLEGLVLEDVTNMPGISTMKSLQLAGSSTTTVNSSNLATTETQTWWSALATGIQTGIVNLVNAGDSVVVPNATTTVGSGTTAWTGLGYAVTVPGNFIQYYVLSGGTGGNITTQFGANTGGASDVAISPTTTQNSITVGEPINPANGDVSHEETDFSIPNLGTPLEMVRSYDSFNTVASGTSWSDRGMGDGWSFSYSDTISAYNSAVDGTQPSGSVTWFTDTGLRLIFTPNGSGWNTPDTVFGTLTGSLSSGFTWTDKDGSTSQFTIISGTAYLTQITDRYEDGVQISYVTGTSHIASVQRVLNGSVATGTSAASLSFIYSGNHIIAITDFTGRTWQYDYDSSGSSGRLISVTAPIASTAPVSIVQYSYYTDTTLNNLLHTVTDQDGNVTTFSYYANRRGFQEADPQSDTQTFSYNLFRNRTYFTNELGQTTSYDYDSSGDVIKQTNPNWTTLSYTWSNGLTTSDADEYGQSENYAYYSGVSTGNPSGYGGNVSESTNALGESTYYTYNSYSEVTAVYNSTDGSLTLNTYNSDGSLATTTVSPNGTGVLSSGAYSFSGSPTEYVTSYTYPTPDRGLPTSMMLPLGQATGYSYTTSYVYNEAGQMTSETSPVVSYSAFWDDIVITQTWQYNSLGNLLQNTDGNGNSTTYTYNILGEQTSATLPNPGDPALPAGEGATPSAPTTVFAYDAAGNPISSTVTTDSPQQTITTTVDSLGRTVRTTNADGTYTTEQYDPRGNVIYSTDAMGRVTQYVYDSLNRRIETINPDGSATRTEYDGGGRIVGETDANGNTVQFAYDQLGRQVEEIQPDQAGNGGTNTAITVTTYDDADDKVYVTDPLSTTHEDSDVNNTTETDYNKLGEKTEVIQPAPATGESRPTTVYGYDADGDLTSITDPRDFTTTYYYDESGRKTIEQDDPGGSLGYVYTWYYYDNDGNLQYVVNSNGATSTSRPATFSASAADTTQYVYDALSRNIETISPTAPSGARPTVQNFYDQNGNLVATTDANGNTTTYTYNVAGQQTAVTDALGDTTTTVYDAVGNALELTNALGWTTFFAYDSMDRKVAEIDPLPQAAQAQAVTTVAIAGLGQVVLAGGPITTSSYDANGNVTSTTDPNGHTSWTEYNTWNLPVAVTDALGSGLGDPAHTTTTAYNLMGNVVSVTDPLGRTTSYVYDNLGRKIEEIDPDPSTGSDDSGSPKTFWGYDANGNVAAVENPLGSVPSTPTDVSTFDPAHTTWYFYDGLNRQTCVVDALADTTYTSDVTPSTQPADSTLTTYYAIGTVATVTQTVSGTSQVQTTTYYYDNLGRKIEEVDPSVTVYAVGGGTGTTVSPTTTFAYDLNGNLLSTTDPDGNTAWTVYDTLNRPVKTVSADGNGPNDSDYATTTVYNALGSTVSITDPDGNVTSYLYNHLNELIETINPLRFTSTQSFDPAGNVVQTTDFDGQTIQFVYDSLNRQIEEKWLDAAGNVFHTINTHYDADSEILGVTETDTTTALHTANPSACTNYEYAYDYDGRLLTSRMAPGDISQTPTMSHPYVATTLTTLTYTYYADGSVDTVSDGSDVSAISGNTATTTYGDDALSRVTSVSQSGTGTTTKEAAFGYYDNSQIHTVALSNGITGTYSYDADARLSNLSYTYTSGGSPVIGYSHPIDYALEYDAAGNITQQASADGTDDYASDQADQLQSASLTSESYAYDQNGNRTGSGYVTGADNLLLSDGTYCYQYDKNGNRIARWKPATSGALETKPGPGDTYITFYTYDYENRLTSATSYASWTAYTGSSPSQVVTFTYDYLGRMICEYSSTAWVTGAPTYTYTVYDGQNAYLEVSDSTPLSGSGTAQVFQRYLYGPAVNQILATDSGSGNVLWGLADFAGTPQELFNNSATIISYLSFNAYGAPLTSTSLSFPVGQNGMRYDQYSGLYLTETVPYDPAVGERLSQDDLGFASGTTNLTTWAANSPVQYADPSGEGIISFGSSVDSYSSGQSFGATVTGISDSLSQSISENYGLPDYNALLNSKPNPAAGAFSLSDAAKPVLYSPDDPTPLGSGNADTLASTFGDYVDPLSTADALLGLDENNPFASPRPQPEFQPPNIVKSMPLGFTGETIDFDPSGQAYYHAIPIVSIAPIGSGKGLGSQLLGDSNLNSLYYTDFTPIARWLLNTVAPGAEPDYQITFAPNANIPWDSPYQGSTGVTVLSGGLTTGQMTNQLLAFMSIGQAARAVQLGLSQAPAVGASEGTNAITNLGEGISAKNASTLSDFGPGSVFSGVYNPDTGQFLAYPSGESALANGEAPINLVPRAGGHGIVNAQFSNLTGVAPTTNLGYTLFLEEDGSITVSWRSGSVNGVNPSFQGDLVPVSLRPQIMETISKATGRVVRSR